MEIVRSLRMLAVMTLLTGVLYPFAVTGIARLAFPHQSGGSLLVREGRVVGSKLIGQPFDSLAYFWSRPSATGPVPYNGAASSGSNLGPLHPDLASAVIARAEALRAADPRVTGPIPVDLLTASGSGLDPHVTPAAALHQVSRVAQARGLGEHEVRRLVEDHIEERTFGFLGEPRVNVLLLNLALDAVPCTAPTSQ